ncbi:peptide ABC transporter substrate-binding protein [Streptomyces otsuchiensis]|uniref:peptide ABC transporter substrate-binding protein n=1 Tax=Streptomyces otsuchiensis TaxID=2681388 RepID=UPI0010324EFF|nr:ABC transporter substrate-binding protein [Streptomyces otsuchiensis]
MRRPRTLTRAAALAGAVILTAAACGSSDDGGGSGGGDTDNASSEGGDYTGGEVRANLTSPQTLITTDTIEAEGSTVVSAVYSKLVDFDIDTGEVVHRVAESIETEDNQTWEITIREGLEFHNGEPVDADSFLRAWNFGAYGDNAQRGSFFYAVIEGFDEVQEEGSDITELSGLEKTGDLSFSVTLNSPFTTFEVALGHNVFLPMAQECLDDIDACNLNPIGNGPFKMASPWEHDVEIALERWEDYPGENTANIDNLTFSIYSDNQTAYNDLQAGNLDVLRTTPPELRDQARDQFTDRFIEVPTSQITVMAYPVYDEAFSDPKIRQALSMAVDRQKIIDNVLLGAFEPADSFIAPVIPGYQEAACEYCQHNPERAKELFDEADWPSGKKLQLHYPPGAGHDEWIEAVGIEIENTLGIEFELRNELEWAEHLNAREDEEMEGPYRSGWIMSYPSQEYYLKPLYTTGGSSADTGWTSEDFDRLVNEGDAAPSLEEAQEIYAEAEQILMEEVPAIPLFYGRSSAAYNDTLDNVIYNIYETNPSWTDLQVK